MIRKQYMFEFLGCSNNTLSFACENTTTQARVFILEDDIVRVLISEKSLKLAKTWMVAPGMDDIPREGRDRLDITPFSCPDFTYTVQNGLCTVCTKKIKVVFDLDGMKASWYFLTGSDDILFARDRRTQAYNLEHCFGDGISHYMEQFPAEQFYGLGEKAGELERSGKSYKMMNLDPMGYDAECTDPLYKHIPFYITRNKKNDISFGIFYDNLSTSEFNMGREIDNYHGKFRYYRADDGDLDYYIILGPHIRNVTERFSWLTGKTAFMPKWSIGYSGSTMTYTDADNAQELLNLFVEDCRKQNIPCNSFQLSSGYTSIGKKRYVFNWNREKIPDPKKLAATFHKNGIRLCANIKPALLLDHPLYNDLAEEGFFLKSRDGKQTELSQFWDDLGSYLDFTNAEAYDWWKQQVTEKLLSYGIDSTWNDNNEYEVWDPLAIADGFGNKINMGQIRPLQSLLMMKASFEAQKSFAPDVRPYLISRSGCPGMQRYVQTWSGDNRTSYKTLKYNIKMGIGLSLSGIYNIGHDVGGFSGEAPEPELFVRWVQNGVFHPRFTIHSWNDDKTVNVPWMYPEYTDMIREAIMFRIRITPYLYDLLYRAHSNYEPVIRPVFYEFDNDEQTFGNCDDFMLGSDLLVATVVEKGSRIRTVYLPATTYGWFEYHTEVRYDGGKSVTVAAPLEYSPLFVRAGAIIPVNTANVTFETKDKDERGFMLYPAEGSGQSIYELFEDDGISYGYRDGKYTKVCVEMTWDEDIVRVQIRLQGTYALPYDRISVQIPSMDKRKLVLNGVASDSGKQFILTRELNHTKYI